MANVIINERYRIGTDPLNFILYERHEVFDNKTKESKGKTTETVVGYYRTFTLALEALLDDNIEYYTREFRGSLAEYAVLISQINEKAVKEIREATKDIKVINVGCKCDG